MNHQNTDLNEILNLAIREQQSGNYNEAKNLYKKILSQDSNHFESNFYLGTLYAQNNNLDEALELLNNAIKINPNVEDVHNNLGLIYRELRQYKKALKCLEKALEINPNYAEALNNLGFVYKEINEKEKAKEKFLKAIEINPHYLEPYNNLGILFQEYRDFENAEIYFNKSLKINPKYVPTYINLGNLFKRQNEIKKSEKFYKDALNINPNYFEAYNNLMNLYERTNQEENLKDLILKSEAKFRKNSTINLFKAKYFYKTQDFQKAIDILENTEFHKNEIDRERSRLLFLGKCHDELDNIDKAFDYFHKMNLVNKSLAVNKNINKNNALEMIEKRYSFFNNIKVNNWSKKNFNKSKESPVFLIGFSRSGTTLLQTILRSHPEVEVIEEEPTLNTFLNYLQNITKNNFENLKNIDDVEILKLEKLYLNSRDQFIKNKNSNLKYIDKEPLNIIHVGEIIKVFPNAKFLVSIRHPYDCILSCFKQNFILNDTLINFLNLDDAANLYDKVMKLWLSYINLPVNYHLIKYEDIVLDFEKTLRETLEFLELPWSDKIFNFYKNSSGNLIATPSYDQVNKPIYVKSIGRWKKYESKISKIFPILDPWVNKFNYSE
tara:strand:+ start:11642 stop:13465 length:1824 start_codon:yes stop_codon:yes gene_type:complete